MMYAGGFMELSVNLSHFKRTREGEEKRSFARALQICRDAGFRYFDYTPGYREEGWEKTAACELAMIEEAGAAVTQSHAPFNRYGTHGSWEEFMPLFHRSFEAAAAVKAQYMVVHADEYRVEDRYDPEEIAAFAYEYLAPEVEFAKKHGMKVAIENLFEEGHGKSVDGKSRYTSRVEELIAIIEKFHDPDVCCCWDFGHAACAYGFDKMLDALKAAGKYVECTHVHDNYYGKDLHLLPFLGSIRWEDHMRYLGEIGYAGKLSYELGYGGIPDCLLPGFAEDAYAVGQHLLSLAE